MIEQTPWNLDFIAGIEQGVPIGELEKRMRPNVNSKWGFLGEDESLPALISSDYCTMQERDLDYNVMADKLEKILARKGCVSLLGGGNLTITEMTCGAMKCPWRDGKDDQAFYTMFFDTTNEEHVNFLDYWKENGIPFNRDYKKMFMREPVMIVSGLMPHLIRDHHFFEGEETAYRISPIQLAKYLKMDVNL